MNQESKINIIAKDGQALIGSAFHTLTGGCRSMFKTSNMESFRNYLKNIKDAKVFYDDDSVVVAPDVFQYNDDIIASCMLSETLFLTNLKEANGRKGSLKSMEEFLTAFLPFMDAEGRKVLDFCKNGVTKKIVEMVRSSDNSGNFNFSLKYESAGKEDFECPKKITFKIPVFNHIADIEEFTFDMYLTSEISQGALKIELWFRDLGFELKKEEIKRKIVAREIASISLPKYYGEISVEKFTDEWKYKKNGI